MKTRFMRDMFRNLDTAERTAFRQWADDNYTAGGTIEPTWHPVVQARCREIDNAFAGLAVQVCGMDAIDTTTI